ncbi:MAG TPA: pyridoxal phosphate-dependent aminotransferase [Bryobacteraceae bacterium]|nr:pyridoxal phosphate-dependent aminotransferase [Bryobacteraceae bacterium]
MKFSGRLPGELHPNALTELLRMERQAGVGILDLTESNPTHAGIEYPAGFLESLANKDAVRYEPEPFGLAAARETIGREYGAAIDRVVMTASTSEAYSWLLKLLCDPGDEILVPRPSYPLFDYLAALESVSVRHYGLFYDAPGWFIDFHTIERALTSRTKAIVLVNPNNPTGHFLHRHELEQLGAFGLPIISDEVFQDYRLQPAHDAVLTLRDVTETLVFTLNGLSKTVGLPQMKLAWMIVNGPHDRVREALARLEIIADTYLSAGTPVQCALEQLLALRGPVQDQILARLRSNLEILQASGLRVLNVEAGWYAIVSGQEEGSELRLLRDHAVLVQPGYFYDFESTGYVVISLVTPVAIFREGVERLRSG